VSEDITEWSPDAPPAQEPDDLRRRLIRQIEQWVDQMRAGEPPPPGVPQTILDEAQANEERQDCDLYTLFSALTVLSGEIRLQGRAFKQLIDALAPLNDLSQRLDRLEDATARAESKPEQDLMPSAKEAMGVLLDLSDRLERGLKTFDAVIAPTRRRSNPLARLFRGAGRRRRVQEATDAIREGYALTLSRLDAALEQWGVQRIGRAGEPFDPLLMTAVEIQSTDNVPEGTVLEVYRTGHILHGQILATAQVKVARSAAS
jgi:molecular chaperone GrpE